MLVIADIGGQFGALMRLVDRVPVTEKIVLVGDLVDRGHFSFEVIEWARKNPRVITILGNHEHMMLDYYRPTKGFGIYPRGCWKGNGGEATKASYARNGYAKPPEEHLDWLESLPLSYWSEDRTLFMSHAALADGYEADMPPMHDNPLHPEFDISIIWNRGEPVKR